MQTCFLFAARLDDEHCLSVCLDESGHVIAPLAQRTAEAFAVLQQGKKTNVVLPTACCSLHEVALPKMSEHKARSVVPYALEEQLAEPVSSLHFALMPHPNHSLSWLVAVINKQYFSDFLLRLTSLGITYDDMTLDWFALDANEACLVDQSLLVNHPDFYGAMGLELASFTFKRLDPIPTLYGFTDPIPFDATHVIQPIVENVWVWLARRLQQNTFLNLCQGDFSQDTKQTLTKRWYIGVGVLLGACLASNVLLKIILLFILTHQNAVVDQQIAKVYREFFPDAKSVVSPRFRIEQLLKKGQSGTDAVLWRLLDQLARAIFPSGIEKENSDIEVIDFRYQNGAMILNVQCQDFKKLAAFEARLHALHVTVRQLAASQKKHDVFATLELK